MEVFPRPASTEVLQCMPQGWQLRHTSQPCGVEEALEHGKWFQCVDDELQDLLRAAAYFFAASCQGSAQGDELFEKLLPRSARQASTDSRSDLPGLWKLYTAATQQDDCDAAADLAAVYNAGCQGVLKPCPEVSLAWHVAAAVSSKHTASAVRLAEGFLGHSTSCLAPRPDIALGYLTFAAEQPGAAAGHARLLLGQCAAKGHGMPASRLRALLYWTASQWEGPTDLVVSCRAQYDAMQYQAAETQFAASVAGARSENNADALFRLGAQVYQGRNGTATDNELAYALFMEAARFDHPRAMSQLGFMSATGRGTEKSEAVALHWLRRSAEAGHGTSMFNYARQCEQGLGLPDGKPDPATAIHWYERAAAGPYPSAIHNLALALIKGSGGEHRRAEGLQLLHTAADPRGHALASAQCSLGMTLESGRPEHGVPRQAAKAAQFLRLAFDRQKYESARAYAQCMLWGRGVKKSFQGARRILDEAMEQNNDSASAEQLLFWMSNGTGGFPTSADGVFALGNRAAAMEMWDVVWKAMFDLTDKSNKLPHVPEQALALCKSGLQSGQPRFHCHLSYMLYTGQGCDVDFEGARASAEVSAESGSATGMVNYAEMLWQGLGGPRNVQGALAWMGKATAESFDGSSQLQLQLAEREVALGLDREQPSVVEQTAASELGDSDAMLWLLHRAYLGGDQVSTDNDELARLLVKATNGGTRLMAGLPPYVWTMYSVAQGPRAHSVAALPSGPALATDTLLRAAEEGCSCAAYCAGMRYLRGSMHSKHADVVQAARWLRRAEELHHPQAGKRMDEAGIVH